MTMTTDKIFNIGEPVMIRYRDQEVFARVISRPAKMAFTFDPDSAEHKRYTKLWQYQIEFNDGGTFYVPIDFIFKYKHQVGSWSVIEAFTHGWNPTDKV